VHARRHAMTRARRTAAGLIAASFLVVAPLGMLARSAGASSGSGSSNKAALAQARKDLLVLSDMPAGWTSTKNPNANNNSSLGNKQLAHCIGVSSSLVAENPPSVYSPQFQNSDGTLTVADNVAVFPSAKNATAEYAVGSNPKFPSCLTALASGPLKKKLFGKLPKGTSIGTPLVSAVAPSALAPGISGYSLSVPVMAQGVTLNVTVTQLITIKGRLGHQVTFTSAGTPFSLATEQQIMKVAAARL
jgi:hypothetical protein